MQDLCGTLKNPLFEKRRGYGPQCGGLSLSRCLSHSCKGLVGGWDQNMDLAAASGSFTCWHLISTHRRIIIVNCHATLCYVQYINTLPLLNDFEYTAITCTRPCVHKIKNHKNHLLTASQRNCWLFLCETSSFLMLFLPEYSKKLVNFWVSWKQCSSCNLRESKQKIVRKIDGKRKSLN